MPATHPEDPEPGSAATPWPNLGHDRYRSVPVRPLSPPTPRVVHLGHALRSLLGMQGGLSHEELPVQWGGAPPALPPSPTAAGRCAELGSASGRQAGCPVLSPGPVCLGRPGRPVSTRCFARQLESAHPVPALLNESEDAKRFVTRARDINTRSTATPGVLWEMALWTCPLALGCTLRRPLSCSEQSPISPQIPKSPGSRRAGPHLSLLPPRPGVTEHPPPRDCAPPSLTPWAFAHARPSARHALPPSLG